MRLFAPSKSGWEYIEDRLIPQWAPWRASLFTIGNGFLGTRGTFEEGFAGQQPATFIHGLFVTPPGELPVLAAVPDWTGVRITIDDEPLRLDTRRPAGFERRLDLRTGLITRTVIWRGAETGVVKVVFRRVASMEDPGLVGLDVSLTALTEAVTITIETGLDATIAGPDGPLWRTTAWEQADLTALSLKTESVDSAHTLSSSFRLSGLPTPDVIRDPDHPRLRASFVLDPGETRTVTKTVRYSWAGQPENKIPDQSTIDEIVAGSAPQWQRRWETSRIDVDGDPDAELALRFAAFHLIAAAPSCDTNGSIGARLLSGYGYRHHVFWDTDVYVIPYLTVTQPDLALTHLRYRHRGLAGARRKAASHGRRGAFYAWESADTGDEVTPEWGMTPDGERVRIHTGEIQDHITACVAWAADHYHEWSGDDDFMRRFGSEMILDGAHYWQSRIEVDDDGKAHIRDVIGPNEYHVHVDDSFFTNTMAAWQLRTASTLGGDHLAILLGSLGLSKQTVSAFPQLADQLTINRRADDVFEAHDGFFELDSIDLESFHPSRMSIQGLVGEKRARQLRLVKQADVVMGLVLLDSHRSSPGTLRANLDFYSPITDHGSSLSLAMHSVAESLAERPARAYDYFTRAVAIDHEDAMERGGDGIHAAAQGGILQAAVFGFAGLALENGTPRTVPRLPDHWKSLGLSFVHRGSRHERLIERSSPNKE